MEETPDPVKELENNIQIILSCPGIYTKQEKNAAQSEVNSMTSSQAGITYFAEYFNAFSKDTTYRFFFNYIGHWFSNFWEEIDGEIIEVMKEFLFNTALTKFNQFGPGSKAELGMAQSLFIFKIFDDWQSFFEESFFEPLKIDIALNFLTQFIRMFGSARKQEIPHYIEFKNTVFSQIAEMVKGIIFQGMSESRPESYDALSYYTQFIDPDWMFDDEILQSIDAAMENTNLIPAALRAIQGYLLSPKEIELKQQILERFDIINILTSIETDDEKIFFELSRILCIIGQIPTLIDDDPSDFIDVACSYLEKSDTVATNAGSFILNYIKKSQDHVPVVLSNTLGKLFTFNAEHSTLEITPCYKILIKLITTCLAINPDESVNTFDELLGDPSSHEDEIEYYTTISQFLKCQMHQKANIERTQSLLTDVIYPIASQISEVEQSQYRMVDSLFSTLLSEGGNDKDLVTAFATTTLNFLRSVELPEILFERIGGYLCDYLTAKSTLFESEELDESIFSELILSNNLVFSKIASALLFSYRMVVERKEILSTCVDMFSTLIGQSELAEARSYSLNFLNFLMFYSHKYAKEIAFPLEDYTEIIQYIINNFPHDPQIQSLVLALCPFIGNDGIEIFTPILSNIYSTSGADGMFRAIYCFIGRCPKYDTDHQNLFKSEEWQTEMFDACFEKLSFLLNPIYTTIPICVSSSDESMISTFYMLFGIIWSNLSEDRFEAVTNLTVRLLDHFYDYPAIFKCPFAFLSNFTQSQAQKPDLSSLIDSLLQFVLAPTFDPSQPKWSDFIVSISKQLSALINTSYNTMTTAVHDFLAALQYPDELISEFIQTTESGGENYKMMGSALNHIVTYRSSAFY